MASYLVELYIDAPEEWSEESISEYVSDSLVDSSVFSTELCLNHIGVKKLTGWIDLTQDLTQELDLRDRGQ